MYLNLKWQFVCTYFKEVKIVKKDITVNTLFYLMYNVLNVLFPFCTGIYVARKLLPVSIGNIAYAQNIVQYFIVFAFLGIPTYGIREVAKNRNDKEELNKIYSELMIINAISTAFFSCIYFLMIFLSNSFRENIDIYIVVGVTLLLNFANNSWLYEGLEEFGFISLRNLFFKAFTFLFLIVTVRNQNDSIYYATANAIGTAGNYIINLWHSKKYVTFTVNNLNFKCHLKSIFILVAVNLAIELYTLTDTTMLGAMCEKNHIAYYSYGSKINSIFLQILNTFTMVLVPRISICYKEKKYEEYNTLLSKTFRILIIISVPMIVGIQWVAEPIICTIYGAAYLNSAEVLRILSVVLLISPVGYLLGSRVLLVTNNERRMIKCVTIGAVVNIVLNYIFINKYNEYGAAIASVISEVIVLWAYIMETYKLFKIENCFLTTIKVGLGMVIMFLFLYVSQACIYKIGIRVLIQIVGGALCYMATLYLTKEPTVMAFVKKIRNYL